jgi:hypothetical protein
MLTQIQEALMSKKKPFEHEIDQELLAEIEEWDRKRPPTENRQTVYVRCSIFRLVVWEWFAKTVSKRQVRRDRRSRKGGSPLFGTK